MRAADRAVSRHLTDVDTDLSDIDLIAVLAERPGDELAKAAWVAVAGGSVAALVVAGFGAELHASPAAIGASALVALAAALVTTLLAFSGPAVLSWQMSPGRAPKELST